jgi:hypothetical protein
VLAAELARYEERRRCDETKLEQMILYGTTVASCRWNTLLDYFESGAGDADTVFRCGTCDACMRSNDLPRVA